MSGHPVESVRRRTVSGGRLTALLAAGSLAALGSMMIAVGPAGAATTVKAQLSLTGIATSDNPTGGSTLGVHPGDTVTLSPATVPTAGFAKLGLDGLLSGLLTPIVSEKVTANFSGLPGGAKNTVLDAKTSKSFTFPKAGKYSFTWSATALNALGLEVGLDGNQLEKAGVKLNAQNQYVGTIVVATNPPKGGIALQLPGVSVQPSLPVVGTLPKTSLPGVTTPTIPVSVPDLNPTKSSSGSSSSSGAKSSITTPVTTELPVPAQVVPQGTGKVYGSEGGFASYPVSGSTGSLSLGNVSGSGTTSSGTKTAGTGGSTTTANSTGKNKTINLASDQPSSASGLPVVLAVVAMLALVLVAGTYARLFLLRKS